MYCSKCGKQNEDESMFCSGCGAALIKNESKQNIIPQNTKSKLFSAHLLNIFAVVVPTFLFGVLLLIEKIYKEPLQKPVSDGGITITVNPNNLLYLSRNFTLLCVAIGLIIFIMGIVIYKIKSPKIKLRLSYIYLVSAIADLALLVATAIQLVFFTCGIGAIMFIPGILQIIAGTKFISGSKIYAD